MDSKHLKLKMAIGVALFAGSQASRFLAEEKPNFIVNGDFEKPQVEETNTFENQIEGWKGTSIEIGKGNIYNSKWPEGDNQVADLDVNGYSQQIDLSAGKYMLSFDLAPKEQNTLVALAVDVEWNGQKVKRQRIRDFAVEHVEIELDATDGPNTIALKASGREGKPGITIDNVRLVAVDQGENIQNEGQVQQQNLEVIQDVQNVNPEIIQDVQNENQQVIQDVENVNPQVVHDVENQNLQVVQDVQNLNPVQDVQNPNQQIIQDVENVNPQIVQDVENQNQEPLNDVEGNASEAQDLLQQVLNSRPVNRNWIRNGDFQNPQVDNWEIMDGAKVPNWNGEEIEIGKGTVYNKRWTQGNQIAEMDPHKNGNYSQNLLLPAGPYKLSLQYAARQKQDKETSWLDIFWNQELVKQIKPEDYEINNVEVMVNANSGQNTLDLRAAGASDSYGITVDNVKLESASEVQGPQILPFELPQIPGVVPQEQNPESENSNPITPDMIQNLGSNNSEQINHSGNLIEQIITEQSSIKKNWLVNGDFEEPQVGSWQIFTDDSQVSGWNGNQIQIGKGTIYNKDAWLPGNQVAEMDVRKNEKYTQKVNLQAGIYRFSLQYAARLNKNTETSYLDIFWNGELVQEIRPTDFNLHKFNVNVIANSGENILQLKVAGNEDGLGITIDNLRLQNIEVQENQLQVENEETNIIQEPEIQIEPEVHVDPEPIQPQVSIQPVDPQLATKPIDPQISIQPIKPVETEPQIIKQPIDPEVTIQPVDPQVTIQPVDPETTIQPINKKNWIINGDFEDPKVDKWNFFKSDEVSGWSGEKIEIGKGRIYNKRWKQGNQIAQMDPKNNQNYVQKLKLEQGLYKLSLDYAARQKRDTNTSWLDIYWNNELLKQIRPEDYEIHSFQMNLAVNHGQNTLQLRAAGESDSFGITVDNVKLQTVSLIGKPEIRRINLQPQSLPILRTEQQINNLREEIEDIQTSLPVLRTTESNTLTTQIQEIQNRISLLKSSEINLIRNGDFEQVHHESPFTGQIPEWETSEIQVGPGLIYNEKWDSQVVKVGNKSSQVLRQILELEPGRYSLSFNWANIQSNTSAGQVEVFWNNRLLASLRKKAGNKKIQNERFTVKTSQCRGGSNVLEFRSPLNTDGSAVTLDNIRLVPKRKATQLSLGL